MNCEYCPAGWEERSYEGECYDFGCIIKGHEMCDDNCRLSKAEIEKRLKEWKDYTSGKIGRPQWVANKFMRELDDNWMMGHSLGYMLPGFPPPWMKNGCHESLYSTSGVHSWIRAVLENLKDDVEKYRADCDMGETNEVCLKCTENVFGSIVGMIDKRIKEYDAYADGKRPLSEELEEDSIFDF